MPEGPEIRRAAKRIIKNLYRYLVPVVKTSLSNSFNGK